jgi:hypothetical protein
MGDVLDAVRRAWSWTGLSPAVLIDVNSFGNLLLADESGRYWRICPEDLDCRIIAQDAAAFGRLRADPEFQRDWTMAPLHAAALESIGPLSENRCYCLKIPAVLGGAYDVSNLGEIALDELISFAGDVAQQVDGLPDGAQIRLLVRD